MAHSKTSKRISLGIIVTLGASYGVVATAQDGLNGTKLIKTIEKSRAAGAPTNLKKKSMEERQIEAKASLLKELRTRGVALTPKFKMLLDEALKKTGYIESLANFGSPDKDVLLASIVAQLKASGFDPLFDPEAELFLGMLEKNLGLATTATQADMRIFDGEAVSSGGSFGGGRIGASLGGGSSGAKEKNAGSGGAAGPESGALKGDPDDKEAPKQDPFQITTTKPENEDKGDGGLSGGDSTTNPSSIAGGSNGFTQPQIPSSPGYQSGSMPSDAGKNAGLAARNAARERGDGGDSPSQGGDGHGVGAGGGGDKSGGGAGPSSNGTGTGTPDANKVVSAKIVPDKAAPQMKTSNRPETQPTTQRAQQGPTSNTPEVSSALRNEKFYRDFLESPNKDTYSPALIGQAKAHLAKAEEILKKANVNPIPRKDAKTGGVTCVTKEICKSQEIAGLDSYLNGVTSTVDYSSLRILFSDLYDRAKLVTTGAAANRPLLRDLGLSKVPADDKKQDSCSLIATTKPTSSQYIKLAKVFSSDPEGKDLSGDLVRNLAKNAAQNCVCDPSKTSVEACRFLKTQSYINSSWKPGCSKLQDLIFSCDNENSPAHALQALRQALRPAAERCGTKEVRFHLVRSTRDDRRQSLYESIKFAAKTPAPASELTDGDLVSLGSLLKFDPNVSARDQFGKLMEPSDKIEICEKVSRVYAYIASLYINPDFSHWEPQSSQTAPHTNSTDSH